MSHSHDKPKSFYRSPKEALHAPREEFLYLACLHEGTGVDKPDFLAVVDVDGNGSGGFAVLDAKTFEIKGRWENGGERPPMNYDFWYQPRKNVLISSEFGEPNAYEPGFDLDDVSAGRYGQRLHFWNLAERTLEETVDLGANGLVPLEVRWLHDPDAEEGFCGAALSSTMWHFHRQNGGWAADQVIGVDGVELEGWPFPVPG